MVPVPRPAAAPPIRVQRLAMPRGNSGVRDACRAAEGRPIESRQACTSAGVEGGGMGSLATHSRPQSWHSRDADAGADTLRQVSNAWAQVPPTILVPKVAYLGGVQLFGAWTPTRALWPTLLYLGGNYNFYPHGEDRACGAKLLCNVGVVDRWLSGSDNHFRVRRDRMNE